MAIDKMNVIGIGFIIAITKNFIKFSEQEISIFCII